MIASILQKLKKVTGTACELYYDDRIFFLIDRNSKAIGRESIQDLISRIYLTVVFCGVVTVVK